MSSLIGTASDKNISKATSKTTTDTISKFEKLNDAIRSTIKLGVAYAAVKKTVSLASDLASEYIDTIETQNLFATQIKNVTDEYGNLLTASSNYYDRAIAFQDELNKKIYTNRSEMMKYQAMYYSMFDSQNIGAEDSYFLSENLTKAGIDIASLFNLGIDEAMDKLKSGISGQVEPLRAIGIDISESSLQTVLDSLGIDRTVQELSYAEKEIARYIAIVNQAGEAQGDFARTFNQPANQIKMFKNQFTELKQVIGNFIMNAFGGIIKYALATVIAIKNVLNAIGELFGWELNTGTDTDLSTSTGIGDLNDNLGSSIENAKELKKQLMGFDEINNIAPPTDSSGSGGSGSVNGIDSALLDGLKEWDMQLEGINDEVTALAEQIENKLMKVVNFVKDNWEEILEVIKAIGVALASWKIAKTVTDILEKLGVIKQGNSFGYAFDFMLMITGLYLMYQGIKKLLSGEVSFESIVETLAGMGMLTAGISDFLRRKSGYTMSLKQGIQYGFGITLLITGIVAIYKSTKEYLSGNIELPELLAGLVGGGAATGLGVFTLLRRAVKDGKTNIPLSNSIGLSFGVGLGVSSISLMYASMKKIISGDGDFLENLASLIGSVATTGISVASVLKALGTSGKKLALGTLTMTAGITLAITSFTTITEGDSPEDSISGILEGALAGASIGSNFGLPGIIIGGLGGAGIASAVDAVKGLSESLGNYEEKVYEVTVAQDAMIKNLNEISDAYESNVSSIKSNLENTLLELDVNQELANSLSKIVDSNGKVKAGYEDRVDYILGELNDALGTELSRNGDLIYNNGEVVTSYSDLQDSINETIEARKKEAKTEAYMQLYQEDLKARIEAQREYNKSLEETQEAYQKWQDAEASGDTELASQYKAEWFDLQQATQDAYDSMSYYTQQLATDSIYAYGEITASAIENGELTAEALQNAVKDAPDTWNQAYSQMEGRTKELMLGMSTTTENFDSDMKDKWQAIATSPQQFVDALVETDEETKDLIASTIYSVENLTPDMVQAWATMAEQDTTKYNELLSVLPEDTQTLLDDLTTLVNEFTPESMEDWATLAETNAEAYNEKTSMLSDDTKAELDEILTELGKGTISTQEASAKMSEKILEEYSAKDGVGGIGDVTSDAVEDANTALSNNSLVLTNSKTFGEQVKSWFDSGLGDGSTSATNFMAGFSGTLDRLKNSITTSVQRLGSSIVSFFNKGLDEHSPSKATALSAKNFVLGFENMLDNVMPDTLNNVAGYAQDITDSFDKNIKVADVLSEGIKVDENAFKADINSMLDYGDINGQIQTQIDVSMNSNVSEEIAEASYNAFVRAMQDEGINVNIEAKTDEGIVLKKVSDGVEDYVRRTGKMPFPVVIGR